MIFKIRMHYKPKVDRFLRQAGCEQKRYLGIRAG
jgi:hypothetical protein